MSEMIERVARALCSSADMAPDEVIWASVSGKGREQIAWKHWEPAARAAIAAMRDPTVAMCEAAAIDDIGPNDMAIFYREMVDEALK